MDRNEGTPSMKILVLGTGVVGVTSAYYLAKAGHEVEVIDRQQAAGLETSFANAGQVSPGYSAPWAGPGVPLKTLRWLLMRHRPFVMWPRADARLGWWLAQMVANCNEQAYRLNKGRMVRLAEYSRDVLRDLRDDTGIDYDQRSKGTLQLFRTQKQIDHVGDDTGILDTFGVPYEVLDQAGCIRAEPALERARDKFVGGLRLPGDETGDAHLFTQRLAVIAAQLGARFRYGVTIGRLRFSGRDITGVETSEGVMTADRYVVALGSYSAALLWPLGLRVPVYPVKGYSLTIPILNPAAAPVSTVMDETFKIAVTRLGDRIRVGGTAELAGFSMRLRRPRQRTLEHTIADLFPDGGDLSKAKFWTGLRPMTPDGTPIVGATPYPKLYTNTGHGTLGWTMACGSARVLADLVSGHSTDIDASDLALARYSNPHLAP